MAEPITLQSVITRDETLLTQDLEEELVIANLTSGNYFSLGESGRRIWDLVERPMAVDHICTALLEEYEIDRTTCEQAVLAFVGRLLEKGIVRVD